MPERSEFRFQDNLKRQLSDAKPSKPILKSIFGRQ